MLQAALYWAAFALYLLFLVAYFGSVANDLATSIDSNSTAVDNLTCPRLMDYRGLFYCQSQRTSLEVMQQCLEAAKTEVESQSWYSTHWLHELAALQRAEVCIGKAALAAAAAAPVVGPPPAPGTGEGPRP